MSQISPKKSATNVSILFQIDYSDKILCLHLVQGNEKADTFLLIKLLMKCRLSSFLVYSEMRMSC